MGHTIQIFLISERWICDQTDPNDQNDGMNFLKIYKTTGQRTKLCLQHKGIGKKSICNISYFSTSSSIGIWRPKIRNDECFIKRISFTKRVSIIKRHQQEDGKIEAFYWSQHSRQGVLNLLKIDHRHIKENSGSKSDPGELTNRTFLSSWSRKLESNFVKS